MQLPYAKIYISASFVCKACKLSAFSYEFRAITKVSRLKGILVILQDGLVQSISHLDARIEILQ